MFCDECGEKVTLPDFDKPQSIGLDASPWLQREEAAARLRSAYEVQLTKVKGYRRNWAVPRCYVSHLPEQAAWANELIHDLRDAGVYVVEQAAQVQPDDFVVCAGHACVSESVSHAHPRRRRAAHPCALEGTTPPDFAPADGRGQGDTNSRIVMPGSFCDETHYPVSLFDLVLTLYAIPLTHAGFAPLRQALHAQWEHMPREVPAANDDKASSKGAAR